MAETNLTLSEAIDKFLLYLTVRKGRSKDTIVTYRSTLGMFMQYCGDIDVSLLTVELIDTYADTLVGYKPKTLRNKLAPIRSLVAFLYAKEIINVRKESIDLPAVTEIEANFLDDEEQQKMLDACKDTRECALILCLLRSGLRVSELINARKDDLFDRSLVVRKGKGGKPRVTFISDDANNAIILYHREIGVDQVYLFPNKSGSKISRQYVSRLVTSVAQRAGITKKVSPHTLRHTFATNLLRAGARIEDVQPMMGHTNMRTTRIYMHFTNDYLKQRYDDIMQNALV